LIENKRLARRIRLPESDQSVPQNRLVTMLIAMNHIRGLAEEGLEVDL
jgi:hypothetical protein